MAAGLIRCERCARINRVWAAAKGIPRCGHCHQPLPWTADADDGIFRRGRGGRHDPGCGRPVGAPVRALPHGQPRARAPRHDLASKIKLVKVNIDEAPQLAQRFDARAVPTLLMLRKGGVTARQAGALPLPVLRTWVEHALA